MGHVHSETHVEADFSSLPVTKKWLGSHILQPLWSEYAKAREAHLSVKWSVWDSEGLPCQEVVRDRPGKAGGKTSRPFPRETIESAIPEGGSVRSPYADPDKGYPSMSDEDLIDRLEGFYLHHKGRGLGVHDGRLMYEFTKARCMTYGDFSNARQLSFGHSIEVKYASQIFRDGFRATAMRSFIIWTLLRAHALRKLGVTLAASEIATLASADMHSGSVRTAWRTIGELEEKGFLIRTNTYKNRRQKTEEAAGRKINFGANTYIAGPKLLAILRDGVSEEVLKDRIVRARRAKRARWQRMRSGEGSEAPALNAMSFGSYVAEQIELFGQRENVRMEMQMIDLRFNRELGPIADAFRGLEEWTETSTAPLFQRVTAERHRIAQDRSEAASTIPEGILARPESEALREAAEATQGLDLHEVQAAIDQPEAVSAVERASMIEFEDTQALERIAQDKRDAEAKRGRTKSIREQLEESFGKSPEQVNVSGIQPSEVPKRSISDSQKASKMFGLNTMPFSHGIPLGISNGEKIRKPKPDSATEHPNPIRSFPPPPSPSKPDHPPDKLFFPPKPDTSSSSDRRLSGVRSRIPLSEEIRRTAEEAAASGNRFAQILLLGAKSSS